MNDMPPNDLVMQRNIRALMSTGEGNLDKFQVLHDKLDALLLEVRDIRTELTAFKAQYNVTLARTIGTGPTQDG